MMKLSSKFTFVARAHRIGNIGKIRATLPLVYIEEKRIILW
jgi:hypothetical protein